jgi:16S rRNA (guanine527-N7)-methyltransferase
VDVSSEFLLEARSLGLLGPGPLEVHRQHSTGFAEALSRVWTDPDRTFDLAFNPGATGASTNLLDLGSGGGVPGMLVAELWTDAAVSVLESSERRCDLLRRWVTEAGWESRVMVLRGRAEELGRDPGLRGHFDAVMARSFGRPSATAECAAPFLRVDGLLVVSDPPVTDRAASAHSETEETRWPPGPLGQLGLGDPLTITDPYHFTILRQLVICSDRYPRRTGVPSKRPLF